MPYESPILIGHAGNLYTGDNAADAAADRPFWAQVTEGPAGPFYGWQEVAPYPDPAGSGGFAFLPRDGGRSGTVALNPAFEPNGGALATYSYVLLRRAYYDANRDWTYAVAYATQPAGAVTTIISGGGGGGSTIITKNAIGTTVDAACTALQMDAAGVMTVSGSGTDTFAFTAAGAAQNGVVNTSAQTWSGVKTFNDGIAVPGTSSISIGSTTPVLISCDSSNPPNLFVKQSTDTAVVLANGIGVYPTTTGYWLAVGGNLLANAYYCGTTFAAGNKGATGTTAEGDTVKGGLITAFGISDARLKRAEEGLAGALDAVRAVAPVRYRWDAAACEPMGLPHDDAGHLGFLAQDLAAAFPEAVREHRADGGAAYLGLDLVAVVAVLWQALREALGGRLAG